MPLGDEEVVVCLECWTDLVRHMRFIFNGKRRILGLASRHFGAQ